MYDAIALEMAIIERLALDAVRRKIASQQLGEAWAFQPVLFSLYRIMAPDGRTYIGVAKDTHRRWGTHCHAATLIGDAIREFGRDAMRFEILACGSREYIYELEIKAIGVFDTRVPNGFNRNAGGFGCRDPAPSTRAKMSNAGKVAHLISHSRRTR